MNKNQATKIDIIPHVRYGENGEIVERYNVEVPRFTDEHNIYITEDWLRDKACRGKTGDASQADYANIGKTVWYRAEGAPDVEIIGMETRTLENVLEVKLIKAHGSYIEVIIPRKK